MKLFFLRVYDDYIFYIMRRNKRILFWLIISFAAGFLIGLLFGGGNTYNSIIFNDSIKYSLQIFSGEISVFTIIIRGFFINIRYFLLVLLFSLCAGLLPLQFLFLAFKGYVFGSAVIIFTGVLGIHGFTTVLIIILPQQFILMFALMLYIAATSPVTLSYKKNFVCFNMHLKTCGVYFLLSLCNIIVELLLLYVIIKPFNILI